MLRQLCSYLQRNKQILIYCLIIAIFILIIQSQLKQQSQHIIIYEKYITKLSQDPTLHSDRININQQQINVIQDWYQTHIWVQQIRQIKQSYLQRNNEINAENKKQEINMKNTDIQLTHHTQKDNQKKQMKQQINKQSVLQKIDKPKQLEQINKNYQQSIQLAQKSVSNLLPAPRVVKSGAGIFLQQKQKFFNFKQLKNMSLKSQMAQQQRKYYQQKYNISAYPQQPFCIVVPSYNNVQKQRYIHNINSILQQDYSNFHIVFIDDASQDKTGIKLQQLAKSHRISQEKLKIIINKERTMAMPNLYRAVHQFCKPYQLLIIADGDDQLIGKQVLKFFNSIFQTYDIWLAYTNFLTFRGALGYSRPFVEYVIRQNRYRNAPFSISHLRVFYAKLFTLINQADLKDQSGKWFRAANDVAMYIPILEMVHTRLAYFPQLTYLYNSNTGLNNHKTKMQEQKGNEKIVKKKKAYKQLQSLFNKQESTQLKSKLNMKIPLKDLNLPESTETSKFGWQL